MKYIIQKIFARNIQYNILSLINVIIAFFFILLLGRHFGMSTNTDTYFFSIVIVTYLGFFVQAIWEAMRPYYMKLKLENRESANELYSILLNNLIILSFIVISLYFLITENINFLTPNQKQFLDIFIFYILFQNILLLNKMTLNLEEHYASFYFVDILVYSINIIIVLFFLQNNILLIAYSTLFATFLANIWQFYLIFKKSNLKYYFKLYNNSMNEIYKNSTKVKIGALFYGMKDPLLATVFLSFGEGLYSLYSYANKFASSLFQITNGPVMNIYVTQLNNLVVKKSYLQINSLIKKVHFETLFLFMSSIILFYFFMPLFLNLFFGDKLTSEDLITIKSIFIYMSIFYIIIALEAPFAHTMGAFKLFNYSLFVNFVFFVFLLLLYIAFKFTNFQYQIYLIILISAQISNLILFVYKNKSYLKDKYEI